MEPTKEDREVDAQVAERVMGTPVVARDWPCGWEDGWYTAWDSVDADFRDKHPAPGEERGPVIATDPDGAFWPPQRHDGDPLHGGAFLVAHVAPVPPYSTDPAADYTVLERVRSEWTPGRKLDFARHLERTWRERRRSRARADDSINTESEAMQYEPGDYARAALAALDG